MWPRKERQEIDAQLHTFRQTHPAPTQDVSWHVRELLNGIHEDLFAANLSVKTLKHRCRMRDHNVSCRFKHEVGTSIKDYVESLRLEAARQLLEQSSSSASAVAQSVGYAHLQTFYRAFVRRFGCTPGDFRRRGRAPNGTLDARLDRELGRELVTTT